MQRFVCSKWKKTQALLKNEAIQPYIPETAQMTKDHLGGMLDKHRMVYIKPDKGTYGNGVMRVEKRENGYVYQSGITVRTFPTYQALYEALENAARGRIYLAQKGIHLLKYNGRRFDIRVMVQQAPDKQWETTGIIGRVAAPKKIVTNFHNGGQLKEVPLLMSGYLAGEDKRQFLNRLNGLGVAVAKQLQSSFPGIKEIGIDVAVDKQYKPWILEVNTCPDPYIFRRLRDKSVFRKVIRYAKACGRIRR